MKKYLLILIIFTLFVSCRTNVFSKSDNSFSVAPPFSDITLSDKDESKTIELEISNNSSGIFSATLSTIDFTSNDSFGGIAFQGSQTNENEKKYSLVSWMTLEKNLITLEPNSSQKVKVSINNKKSLTPGGHYGAVLITLNNDDKKGTLINLRQSYASLFFVKKTGEEKYNMSFNKYEYSPNVFKINDKIGIDLLNQGNVHIIPRGSLKITDPFNRIVFQGILNPDSGYILPQTYRTFPTVLSSVEKVKFPGFYNFKIDYRYDEKPDFETKSFSFFYIGKWWLIIPIVVFLFFLQHLILKKIKIT